MMLWVVLACWLGMVVAARGTALDAASLEREVRGEVLAFGVASGRVRAEAGQLAELDAEMLARVARVALAGNRAGWREAFAELGRRELPAKLRGELCEALVDKMIEQAFEDAGKIKEGDLPRALVEEWGRALWADWEAGAFTEEERREVVDGVESFCGWMSLVVKGIPEEEREEWWERRMKVTEERLEHRGERVEAWKAEEAAAAEKESAERARRTAEVEREEAGKGEVWRRMRRGVELEELGRTKDASAEWRRAAEVAEAAGDEESAWEARALLAGRGDWAWRRGEQREMCEEEIAAGSPWGEYLRAVEVGLAEDEGRFGEALDFALEGWLETGAGAWGQMAGEAAAMRGGVDAELCQAVAGAVLEKTPAVEERREDLKRLVILRWALGEFYPGRAARTLEGDLEGLRSKVEGQRSKVGEEAADGTAAGKTREGNGGRIPRPGERWEGVEPSWRTDGAFPEIERELNEILLAEGDEELVEAWRAKWSLEERRGVRVNGAGGEFAALAAGFWRRDWWEDWKERGKEVLEEAKAQEGYDGERLFEVLARMAEWGIVGEGEADATEVTGWVDWARRVAAGDPVLEARAAALEARRAVWLEDEAALRRVAAGNLERVVRWGSFSSGGGAWTRLAKGGDERKAAELALTAVKMVPGLGFAADAMALMDVMTAAELEAFRDALWMKALTDPWGGGVWWERLARWAGALSGGGWMDVEAQLRLARLEERGAECGGEGMALAERLGEGSARGMAVGLKGRLAGWERAEGDVEEAKGGRWAGWCAGVEKVAEEEFPGMRAVFGEAGFGGMLPPWLDRMAQRRLREALADWGGETTEGEREAVEEALERLGFAVVGASRGEKAEEELLEDWRTAAAAAGAWAAEALERGREAQKDKKGEEDEEPGVAEEL